MSSLRSSDIPLLAGLGACVDFWERDADLEAGTGFWPGGCEFFLLFLFLLNGSLLSSPGIFLRVVVLRLGAEWRFAGWLRERAGLRVGVVFFCGMHCL